MTLRAPFLISARLMPALSIGGAFLSMGSSHKRDTDGRTRYGIWIDLPDGQEIEINDMRSGSQGGSIQQGFASLLSFLNAAAESFRYRGLIWENVTEDDNATLFPRAVVEWAYQNDSELQMLALEIEETPELISGEDDSEIERIF